MLRVLDQCIQDNGYHSARLGFPLQRNDIKSSLGQFSYLPSYVTRYPDVVVEALFQLYREYNKAFIPLVKANREWETDYQFCFDDGVPVNGWIQVDMVGLPQAFLDAATMMTPESVREALRKRIYEIENSLAMYQMLERIYENGAPSSFKQKFRTSLFDVRRRYGLPIALLAVTEEKHEAMRQSEFGKKKGETLSDNEVFALSGFNRLFSPAEFRKHLAENNGKCGYLLYVRSSDPVAKLKRPDLDVHQPLLSDPLIRRVIKAHTLTLNIDSPEMDFSRRINDTKEYMIAMRMGYELRSWGDVVTSEFEEFCARAKPNVSFIGRRMTQGLEQHLQSEGYDPCSVTLRCKPMKGTYGCYGHVCGRITEGRFRQELRRNLRRRGSYVLQPEMPAPIISDVQSGLRYTYIDRNFLWTDGRHYTFLGGFRSLMPLNAVEARKGRNHGNGSTVWAEILS